MSILNTKSRLLNLVLKPKVLILVNSILNVLQQCYSTKYLQRIFTKFKINGFDSSRSPNLNMIFGIQHSSKPFILSLVKILRKPFIEIVILNVCLKQKNNIFLVILNDHRRCLSYCICCRGQQTMPFWPILLNRLYQPAYDKTPR